MKLKYSFLLLFIACSKVKTSEQALDVSISPKFEIQIGESGNTSQLDYVSSILNDSSFLILNKFLRSIDTVRVGTGSGKISIGNPIPFEGPNGIEIINYFQEYKGELAFIDNITIYLPGSDEVKRLKINEFKSSQLEGLLSIASINSKNKVVSSLDEKDNLGYFFLLDIITRKLKLSVLDFEKKEINLLDFAISEKLDDHIILNQVKRAAITNPYYPNLFLTDDKLIVSYPFVNQIQIYSIKTGETVSNSPKTNLYKVEKDLPERILTEISFKEYQQISVAWQADVLFGPFMEVGSNYFRFIRGEHEVEGGLIYMELFNKQFEKIGEVNLSAIQPDLGMCYMPIGNRIFVKAKSQANEDILEYYLISLD
jgi:hypothetical protein